MVQSDFLVIGSGLAGLIFALKAANHAKVIIVTKRDPLEGSTKYAQGGIAAVTDPDDFFESHIEDTLIAGAGLCDKEVVKNVVEEAPDGIKDLISLGVNFDTQKGVEEKKETYSLGREGGHSKRRILHVGDMTGLKILEATLEEAKKHPNIEIKQNHTAIDLILKKDSKKETEVIGAYVLEDDKKSIIPYVSKCTLLATGGAGKVYLVTSNPDISTGDGISMAYRAGAEIGNMEFFQFHPTCLYHMSEKSFLISEAMRGEGAKLLTLDGKRFMENFHKDKELAPRDIVARAIDATMKESGSAYVHLDISHKDKEFIKKRFPTIYKTTLSLGFDITKGPIPVVPAAHYCCGGIKVNKNGETSLKRLYACGECSFTGLHGANRLASNSLIEAVVYANRASKDAIKKAKSISKLETPSKWDHLNSIISPEKVLVSHLWQEVRLTMWNLVGIVRSNKRLELAKKRIDVLKKEVREYYLKYRVTNNLIELRNIMEIADLIITSSLKRKESRGLHFNIDYPKKIKNPEPTILKR